MMKKLLFITTALTLFLLTACDNGDDPGKNSVKLLPKNVSKLQIRNYSFAGTELSRNEYIFAYDSQNRIAKIDNILFRYKEEVSAKAFTVTYETDKVVAYNEIEETQGGVSIKYVESHTGTLTGGLITEHERSMKNFVDDQEISSYDFDVAFTYNAGKLTRFAVEVSDEDNVNIDFIWTGNNISEVDLGYKQFITYGEEPNNINLDFWFLIAAGDEFLAWLAFPGYFGKRCANLPEKITVKDGNVEYDLIYEYTRDSAGYLTMITFKSGSGIFSSYEITYEQ